jgi:hypothetical protein
MLRMPVRPGLPSKITQSASFKIYAQGEMPFVAGHIFPHWGAQRPRTRGRSPHALAAKRPAPQVNDS